MAFIIVLIAQDLVYREIFKQLVIANYKVSLT